MFESKLIFEELVLGWPKSLEEVVGCIFKFSVIGSKSFLVSSNSFSESEMCLLNRHKE